MHWISLMAVLGCEQPKETGEPPEPEDTSEDTDTQVDNTDNCVPDELADGPRFDGSVVYADGTEVTGNVRVQMCSYSCYIASWGPDGQFCFNEGALDIGTTYAFDAVPTTGEPNTYATPLTFITMSEEGLELSSPVVIPNFAASQNASTATFDAGNGLTINVDSSTFDEESIHAVSMDPDTAGLPLLDFADKTIIGMWYFGPFDTSTGGYCSASEHTSESDCDEAEATWTATIWSFTMEGSGLEAGAQVQIYNTEYSKHIWQEAGTATVNAEGILVSDDNSGLTNLSGLVLVQ